MWTSSDDEESDDQGVSAKKPAAKTKRQVSHPPAPKVPTIQTGSSDINLEFMDFLPTRASSPISGRFYCMGKWEWVFYIVLFQALKVPFYVFVKWANKFCN